MKLQIDNRVKKSALLVIVGYTIFRCIFYIGGLQPWYDEAFYSDVAVDCMENGTYHVPVDYPRTLAEQQIWNTLGYSLLQGSIFDLFGISVCSVRLPSLFYGMFIFYVFLRWVYVATGSWKSVLVFSLLFATDKTLNPYLFAGRPDVQSFFLIVCSICLFNLSVRQGRTIYRTIMCVGSGLLLAAGCGTTLRTAIAVSPFVLLLFFYRPQQVKQARLALLLYGLTGVVAFAWGYVHYFGGIEKLSLLMQQQSEGSQFSAHFGFHWYRNLLRTPYNAPKFSFFYGCVFFLIYKYYSRIKSDFFLMANLMIVLGFTLFIKEAGQGSSNPYSIMILPTVYLVFVYLMNQMQPTKLRTGLSILVVCISITNLVTIGPKTFFLLLNPEVLKLDSKVSSVIGTYVNPDEVVLTDQQYYFALKEQNVKKVLGIPKHPSFQVHPNRLQVILDRKHPSLYLGELPDKKTSEVLHVKLIVPIPNIRNRGGKWLRSRYGYKECGLYRIEYP